MGRAPPAHVCDAVPEQSRGCESMLQFSAELAGHSADPPVTGYRKKNRYQPSAARSSELELQAGAWAMAERIVNFFCPGRGENRRLGTLKHCAEKSKKD